MALEPSTFAPASSRRRVQSRFGRFDGVVEAFVVVGVGAGLEQDASEFGVVILTGGAVEGAERGAWEGGVDPVLIGTGSGVEEEFGGGADAGGEAG